MSHLLEVEAKILGVTERELLPRLMELGFKPYFEGILKAQWLMNPANGEKIRVRQENDIVMVEHKALVEGGNEEVKSRQETGFEARDFEMVIVTFCKIGLEKAGLPSIKRRVSYVRDYGSSEQVRLDFDTYSELGGKSIPEFLEIEATGPEKVYETAEALGFRRSDCRNFDSQELFQYYYPRKKTA
ncbi:MAG: hypothetical protein PHH16_01435 [Candidatus Gracilibacteria bacterium]|nr:hypothetical protein [Candidatus Gracilibacteria bacterium]